MKALKKTMLSNFYSWIISKDLSEVIKLIVDTLSML